ncbi:MAG: helix-turn-helix transcriptional regulator [Candidatus Sedimenticola sp. (ex Thyasira tokunagai)]
MPFQKKRRNWKRMRPTSLREALRLCKEHGREKKNLSVERIAELMDVSPDALYKWLSNASMPAGKIANYEHICGCHFASDYLAASNNRLVIEIPTGKAATALDINELQATFTDALHKLIKFYSCEADQRETEDGLTHCLAGLAWHRENVHKADQPELELGED